MITIVVLQARDIQRLCQAEAGYEVSSVQICDMFPQTAEVESVVILKRKPGARQKLLAALEAQNAPAARRRQLPVGGVRILDKLPQFPQIVRPDAGTTRGPVGKPGLDRPRISAPKRGPKGGDGDNDALDW